MARTRTRITVSLEREQAERIRQHAERAGLDVSTYLVHAATRQMADIEAVEEQFSAIDALIAAAEAGSLPPGPDTTAPKSAEQERRDAEAALNLSDTLE